MLKTLVEKFQSRPHKGTVLIPWIRQIMVQHASYLITVPQLSEYLSGFFPGRSHHVGLGRVGLADISGLNRKKGETNLDESERGCDPECRARYACAPRFPGKAVFRG